MLNRNLMTLFLCLWVTSTASASVETSNKEVPAEVVKKILAAGVPEKALSHLLDFRQKNSGRSFEQDVYTCSDKPVGSIRPCDEQKRSRSQKTITVTNGKYLAIMDFTQNSLDQRMFFIDIETGAVERFRVAHGKGSGELYAYKFSNIKDSKQTSLGIFVTGDTYVGDHGVTLRMYGLERSNDQAYMRDIVFHGAWYAENNFPKSINPSTKLPYNRLGQSWGCPAVDTEMAKRLIPYLQSGSLIYHYYPALEQEAMNVREVIGPIPAQEIRPSGN